VFMLSWWWSFCGDLGDGGSRAGFVDDGLAVGVGGDQGLDGKVVDGSGDASTDLVDQRHGVVGEQGVGAAGELEVMGKVGLGLGFGHPGHRIPQRDALARRFDY
jgi:hypothetical protein